MNTEIKILFSGDILDEKAAMTGIQWEELLPEINRLVKIRPDEQVTALTAWKEGITIYLSRKRKSRAKVKQ